MFGPDVTFLGVSRAELGDLAGLDVVVASARAPLRAGLGPAFRSGREWHTVTP
jgi:hypothetical protein